MLAIVINVYGTTERLEVYANTSKYAHLPHIITYSNIGLNEVCEASKKLNVESLIDIEKFAKTHYDSKYNVDTSWDNWKSTKLCLIAASLLTNYNEYLQIDDDVILQGELLEDMQGYDLIASRNTLSAKTYAENDLYKHKDKLSAGMFYINAYAIDKFNTLVQEWYKEHDASTKKTRTFCGDEYLLTCLSKLVNADIRPLQRVTFKSSRGKDVTKNYHYAGSQKEEFIESLKNGDITIGGKKYDEYL